LRNSGGDFKVESLPETDELKAFMQMQDETREEVKSLIKGMVSFDVPMARHTSLKVGGNADVLAFPQDETDLRKILQLAGERIIPYYILGRGTNVIVRDGGLRGIVISLCRGFKEVAIIGREAGELFVSAGAGANLKALVQFARKRNLTGLEPFSGIPGTVGGALAMNAGAFGAEMADVVRSVTTMDETGRTTVMRRDDLKFSYRNLALPKGSVILSGTLGVREAKGEEIAVKLKDVQRLRYQSQPWNVPTAGSIFKNPEEIAAGQVIDELGLKGYRIGDARISEKHANFIVNEGGATAAEVLALMAFVQDEVYEKRGIRLIPEVHIMGEG
jgi:UDP-N-acetylmuramate dehydrogenase